MLPHYFTIKKQAEKEIIIQKSRFIAHVKRANTEDEALEFIQNIKKEHWNATHNCSAYMIGEHNEIQKANDDGEPSGTAGIPMLEVLKRRELKNTVVVVTRYFGGIKLGAGGLIRAYSRSTTEGIDEAGIVERKLTAIVHIEADYPWLGKIENELRSANYVIKDILYSEQVEVLVYVDDARVDQFKDWVIDMTNGQAKVNVGETVYVEFDVSRNKKQP